MPDEIFKRDSNFIPVVGGVTDDANLYVTAFRINPTTKRILTESTVGSASTVGTGTITVTTGGTSVQLPDQACSRVWIQALETNTGVLVVGDGSVSAGTPTVSNRRGLALYPTQGSWFTVSNLNLLYLDSTISADKAHFYYEI